MPRVLTRWGDIAGGDDDDDPKKDLWKPDLEPVPRCTVCGMELQLQGDPSMSQFWICPIHSTRGAK